MVWQYFLYTYIVTRSVNMYITKILVIFFFKTSNKIMVFHHFLNTTFVLKCSIFYYCANKYIATSLVQVKNRWSARHKLLSFGDCKHRAPADIGWTTWIFYWSTPTFEAILNLPSSTSNINSILVKCWLNDNRNYLRNK